VNVNLTRDPCFLSLALSAHDEGKRECNTKGSRAEAVIRIRAWAVLDAAGRRSG